MHLFFNYKKDIYRAQVSEKNHGLTLLELIIVIALFSIIVAIGVPVYDNWQTSAYLDAAADELVLALRTARAETIAGANAAAYGVYLGNATTPEKIVVYQGGSYATRDATQDWETDLNGRLRMSFDMTGNDINFSQVNGFPGETGTVVIAIDGSSDTRTVGVNSLGMASYEN